MKIASMATGGIGGYLAVKLSNAGFKFATIARGDHLTAINENGLISKIVFSRKFFLVSSVLSHTTPISFSLPKGT